MWTEQPLCGTSRNQYYEIIRLVGLWLLFDVKHVFKIRTQGTGSENGSVTKNAPEVDGGARQDGGAEAGRCIKWGKLVRRGVLHLRWLEDMMVSFVRGKWSNEQRYHWPMLYVLSVTSVTFLRYYHS